MSSKDDVKDHVSDETESDLVFDAAAERLVCWRRPCA
jgi:hypothetical protein